MRKLFFICLVLVMLPIQKNSLRAQAKQTTLTMRTAESNQLTASTPKRGKLVSEQFPSQILRENQIGLNPNRLIKVYLPPNYAESNNSYPVLYYLHNTNWSAEQLFEDGNLVKLLEQGFAMGVLQTDNRGIPTHYLTTSQRYTVAVEPLAPIKNENTKTTLLCYASRLKTEGGQESSLTVLEG